ncbi:hypothetical protein [Agrilutibacter solisilvae]|uniref:Uncharacterized protein n=1 Tax=Agrilutibacter solisilvae TaxID=2763317 RepID=A0A974XYP0_9GAMM|nr:hypothetical protein [Lysobacter solisilvae]QSX78222.1 hypothetical protein I8J32_016320 [Lysobacter solisilvae]
MTSHDPREPLDADERELAGRLSRLGPVDGPSPALDARILAAAHAAAATRTRPARRRWAAWAVPPAAITGVGVAAACVLALGVVWQMRPRVSMAPVAAESTEEVFIAAEPAGSRAPVDNPPPFEAAADAATAAAPPQPQARARAGDEYAQAKAATEAAPAVAQESDAAAAPFAVAPSGSAAAAAPSYEGFSGNAAANARADKALADDAAASTGAAAAVEEAARQERRATYTSAARATAERGLRAPPAAQAAPPAAPAPAPAREAAAFPQDEAEAPTELDAISVTGSRIAAPDLAAIPARDDARLKREDWLDRIRARRDAGDRVAARESLRLFRRAYPQVRLPEDLRSLATDAAP